MTTTQTTKVNRGWLIKRVILPTIVLLGLGIWGLMDAAVVYPRSGRQFASLSLRNYLQTAQDAHRLTPSFVKVDDPAAELKKLAANEKATAAKDVLTPMERARLEWLRALKMVWALNDKEIWVADVKRPLVSKTGDQVYAGVGGVSDAKQEVVPMFFVPSAGEGYLLSPDKSRQAVSTDLVLKRLQDYWTTRTATPLAFYDLPLQWLFVVVGFSGSLYLIVLCARVTSKRYRFEPETHALTLPNGTTITPSDLKEVDKRKWHKFYVALHLKDGSSRTFDLMRYDPLEDWILAMEKVAFPESQAEEGTRGDDDENATDDALAVPKDTGHVSSMTYGGLMDGVFAVFVFDAAGVRASDRAPAAYAQGEVLKALGVAMREEGGWRQWLTVASGPAKGAAATSVADWLAEREPTFKAAAVHVDGSAADAVKNGNANDSDWYVVVVGRLSEPVAKKAHEILMDPPPTGFTAFAALRVHPPTIERFQQPLGLEPGMEIKGDALVGSWEASREDIGTAGLKVAAGEEATA